MACISAMLATEQNSCVLVFINHDIALLHWEVPCANV